MRRRRESSSHSIRGCCLEVLLRREEDVVSGGCPFADGSGLLLAWYELTEEEEREEEGATRRVDGLERACGQARRGVFVCGLLEWKIAFECYHSSSRCVRPRLRRRAAGVHRRAVRRQLDIGSGSARGRSHDAWQSQRAWTSGRRPGWRARSGQAKLSRCWLPTSKSTSSSSSSSLCPNARPHRRRPPSPTESSSSSSEIQKAPRPRQDPASRLYGQCLRSRDMGLSADDCA